MKKYLELIKVNISLLVIVTCYIGYYLGLRFEGLKMIEPNSWIIFFYLLLGTFISSSGASILNQCLEVDYDNKMERTKNRPLPRKKIDIKKAFIAGFIFSFLGPLIILIKINFLTSLISFITIFVYVCIYTPLKRYSSINTIIGAIPGALPPLGGWTAATNQVDLPGLMLFSILFCWQIPHFLSLAIIYKDDYAKAGYKMLPSISDNLDSTMFQIVFFTVALIVSSICIYLLKLTSIVYVIGAIILGMVFLFYSSSILFEESNKKIRRLFLFSIIYFPLLLLLIFLDTIFL